MPSSSTIDARHRHAYGEEAQELLAELEAALLELEDAPTDQPLIDRVFRALHTIKGSGAMFGFDDIAAFTHDVENVFDLVRGGTVAISRELLNLTLQAKDVISDLLAAGLEFRQADLDASQALAAQFRKWLPKPAAAVAARKAGPAAPGTASTLWSIRFAPKAGILFTGANPLCLLDELAAMGAMQAFPYLQGVGRLEDLNPEEVRMRWDIILATTAPLEALQDVFMFVEEDADIAIRAIDYSGDACTIDKKIGEILLERGDVRPQDLQAILAAKKPLGEMLAEAGVVSREQVASALAEQQIVRARREERKAAADAAPAAEKVDAQAASIRVAASKLDFLVDLVGEMVIVQARINQVVQQKRDPILTTLSEELERLCDNLRDATLGIRMLPIGATFSKFRRLVRDLSEELGKEIDLEMRGEETELDKTVIERLGDPLVHLLRNSIDHGIEQPDVREAAGKPRRGSVRLVAEHSGGEVHIHIDDDGQGIDKERVRAKAVERGLISSDAEFTDAEIYACIFQPGFSTASAITNVSGRGVGMDVVKRSIDALRGSIEVTSVPQQGTAITIKLPLTLAIIDGLEIQVGQEFFVIPLTHVEECVELPRKAAARDDSREQIVNLRGEIVPYIRLRKWFTVPGDAPPIEQIVVVRSQGLRVGIVVDTVIGEMQTVIKSLGRVFRDVQGVSGATIKGDGSMALILDIPQLLQVVTAASR
ncbi:putative CheA signal transduction histidine kinase [Megalodesulfovibrio gigas DSM 1382 = ATCC 19364]|uniref:Chemotaxis protein CheA n=1 Tax=Megalodesulfovibrio gigas (strain ATCC 19364 / DSM 1382 / NCIMB 9332 / VKM B-1759) TaxID=1121448 RepID=T2GFS6_MEGG1|nr:putative CheA signal transduction histidine kinase [Megalodesulfovibrio gigas DSM 1382 = ATCC 19364]